MLIKEAKEITGGLSKPSKMPGPAYNLPATQCITGAKLVNVKGSTCSGCYALKGNYVRFPAVQKAMERRARSLVHDSWITAMVVQIKKHRWFRWHDSGDLQSVQHLNNIFEVCKLTPDTRHWLPTREARFLNLMDPDVVPKNLKIVLSDHMNNQQVPPSWWPYTSGVTTDHNQVSCPASKQGNKCRDCRKCWDRNTKRVIYGKH
jgi:hypothetical protein